VTPALKQCSNSFKVTDISTTKNNVDNFQGGAIVLADVMYK